jgi:hypothetical protein
MCTETEYMTIKERVKMERNNRIYEIVNPDYIEKTKGDMHDIMRLSSIMSMPTRDKDLFTNTFIYNKLQ